EPVRSYPMGKLAAHVIGFVGADAHGLEGVELAYEKYLKATPGKRVVYRDVQRRAIFQEPDSYVAPRDGMNVVLTLDANIQEVLEKEVGGAVERFQAECAVGLVMSVKTGEVLAMACAPTYDPAEANKYKPERRRNRILTDPMEPGSAFKQFVMATALAEGVTKPTESIFCHNGLYVTGARRLSDHEPYGSLTVEQIMIHSSNIGMAILGQRLGNMRMHRALKQFGFGSQTGIDLPGEGEGILMPLKSWNSFTTTSVPMGQELAVTPIQLATAFCGLINGGQKIRPRVVAAVVDRNGEVIEDHTRVGDLGTVVRADVAATMRGILAKVVNEGTGRNCRLDQWQVMGKTGTAQVPRTDRRGYEPDAYLGTFIAGVPADDPEIVCLVQVRKPNRRIAYYGSAVAAPSVRTVLAYVLPYLDIPPDEKPAATGKPASLALDRRP
ncbi:MAG TPA: penicillin-binding protein 2, partial [Phycisphaerae bacterium]|nr:penicillin-binding protein 2 [Phycisphaerae bacterium]